MKGTWLKIFMKEEDTTPFGMHIFIVENIHIFGGIWIIFSHLETEEYISCMVHTYIYRTSLFCIQAKKGWDTKSLLLGLGYHTKIFLLFSFHVFFKSFHECWLND